MKKLFFLFLGCASSLWGATITWEPPALIASDTDPSTEGSLRYAYTLSGKNQILNGVAFSNTVYNGGAIAVLGNSDVYASVPTGGMGRNATTFGANIGTRLSQAYTNIICGAIYGPSMSNSTMTVSLRNLTPGRNYLVQLWVNDSRAGATTNRYETVTAGNTSGELHYNDTHAVGGVGAYVIGHFTADAATQSMLLIGDSSAQLNAIQVREKASLYPAKVFGFSAGWDETLSITAAGAWTLASDSAWATLPVASGSGPTNLTLTIAANESGLDRSATLTLSEGGGDSMCTLTQKGSALPSNPVTSGLLANWDAMQLASLTFSAEKLSDWNDVSGNNIHCDQTNSAAYPVWRRESNLDGRPVVDFPLGTYLHFSQLSTIRTVFWIWRGGGYLLGDSTVYDFHRGGVMMYPFETPLAGYNVNTYNGIMCTNGTPINSLVTRLNGEYQLISLTTLGNVSANQLALDRGMYPARAGGPQIGEILIYDRVLSLTEKVQVERYLADKWGTKSAPQVSPTAIDAVTSSSGGTRSFDLYEPDAWTLTTDAPSWISLSAESGTGNSTITVTLAPVTQETMRFGTITVTSASGSAVIPVSQRTVFSTLPIQDSLLRWYDAADSTSLMLDEAGRVSQWNDKSPNALHATQSSALFRPVRRTDIDLLKPVLDFPLSSAFMSFSRATTIRSVLWVVKGGTSLLGDSGSYHFHRGAESYTATPWNATYTHLSIRAGKTYLDGTLVDGTATAMSGKYQVVTLLATNVVEANQLANDRNIAPTRVGNQQLAEIVMYERELTNEERLTVEAYLREKWFAPVKFAWSGAGDATWDTTGNNWTGLTGADTAWDALNGTTNTAIFSGAETILSVAGTVTAAGLSSTATTNTFNDGGSGSLSLSEIAATSTRLSVNVPINPPHGALAKNQSGTLDLNAVNAFSNIAVHAGVVNVNAAPAAPWNMAIGGGSLAFGVPVTAKALTGAGTLYVNENGVVTLDQSGDNTLFYGRFEGNGRIIKKDPYQFTLSSTTPYTAAVNLTLELQAGTVTVVRAMTPPVTSGLQYQLDASVAAKRTVDGSGYVTAWTHTLAGTPSFTGASGSYPIWVPTAFGGRGAVKFGFDLAGAAKSTRLATGTSSQNQTVILLNRPIGAQNGFAGIWGRSGSDTGIRSTNTASAVTWMRENFCGAGSYYLNSNTATAGNVTFTADLPQILVCVSSSRQDWATALGNYWNSGTYPTRYYKGEIAEVLVYNRALTASEVAQLNNYLVSKWALTNFTVMATTQSFPQGDLVLTGGALDLGATLQKMKSCSGHGTVQNGVLWIDSNTNTVDGVLNWNTTLRTAATFEMQLPQARVVLPANSDLNNITFVLTGNEFDYRPNRSYMAISSSGPLSGTPTFVFPPSSRWKVTKSADETTYTVMRLELGSWLLFR